jgi:L-cysteate sulfo-lyase
MGITAHDPPAVASTVSPPTLRSPEAGRAPRQPWDSPRPRATPIQPFGVRGSCALFVKRDDLFDLHGFGFKSRKVHHVLANARAAGYSDLILDGCDDSACCAATAVAGRKLSLPVHIMVRGRQPERASARLRQTSAAATSVSFVDPGGDIAAAKLRKADEIRLRGGSPLVLPPSLTTVDALAAGLEVAEEIAAYETWTRISFDVVFMPVGTGGTLLGFEIARLLLAPRWRVVGICIDDLAPEAYRPTLERMYAAARELRFPALPAAFELPELVWPLGHLGYRIPSDRANREADRIVRTRGVRFDPTYVAKAWTGAQEWLDTHPDMRTALLLMTGAQP